MSQIRRYYYKISNKHESTRSLENLSTFSEGSVCVLAGCENNLNRNLFIIILDVYVKKKGEKKEIKIQLVFLKMEFACVVPVLLYRFDSQICS